MIKRAVAITLIVFTLYTLGIILWGISVPETPSDTTRPADTYTTAEVARHSSQDNCWIIVDSLVYNVTSYLAAHPGGTEALAAYCGKDATTAFTTRNLTPPAPHSEDATTILAQFFIGELAR